MQVLLVAAEPEALAQVGDVLDLCGHDVRIVHTCSAALAALQSHEPDVVLLQDSVRDPVARWLARGSARDDPSGTTAESNCLLILVSRTVRPDAGEAPYPGLRIRLIRAIGRGDLRRLFAGSA